MQGFTLVIRELSETERLNIPADINGVEPDPLWLELRFNEQPNSEWLECARGILTRMSCAREPELHGRCKSHSPAHVDAIMQDALDALEPTRKWIY